jgi:hypothetical protein
LLAFIGFFAGGVICFDIARRSINGKKQRVTSRALLLTYLGAELGALIVIWPFPTGSISSVLGPENSAGLLSIVLIPVGFFAGAAIGYFLSGSTKVSG